MTGVSKRNIWFYEKEGLLCPGRDSKGFWRRVFFKWSNPESAKWAGTKSKRVFGGIILVCQSEQTGFSDYKGVDVPGVYD